MTYAIIKVAGKQYRVREGERLLVDRLHQDEGATFAPTVLLVGGDGAPQLDPGDGVVTAKVLGDTKGPKIRIGKYKKRTGYRRHTGFRASLTQIQIESIGGGKPSARGSSRRPNEAEAPSARPRGRAREGHAAGYEDMTVAEIKDGSVRAGTGRCSPPRSSTSRRTRTARAPSRRSSRRSADKEGES